MTFRFGFLLALLVSLPACGAERARSTRLDPAVAPRAAAAAPSSAPAPSSAAVAPSSVPAPSGAPARDAPAPNPEPEYATPLVGREELAALAAEACARAKSAERFVLVEFSAAWCEDCRVLERVKRSAPLADELANWEVLAINVGDGFQHPDLMRAFRVTAIAKLVTLAPRSCGEGLERWPGRGARTLSGVRRRDALGAELSTWLAGERRRLARAARGP